MIYPTEKQLYNKLNKYYKENFGEKDTDEWFVNPKPNHWKFVRNGRTINLIYNINTGEISVLEE